MKLYESSAESINKEVFLVFVNDNQTEADAEVILREHLKDKWKSTDEQLDRITSWKEFVKQTYILANGIIEPTVYEVGTLNIFEKVLTSETERIIM